MDYKVEQRADVTLVHLTGSVDGLTADSVRGALQQAAGDGLPQVVADLAGVDYASSEGLRALLTSLKASRQKGGDLRLASVQPEVNRLLDLSGFLTIFKVFDDTDAAVASFGS